MNPDTPMNDDRTSTNPMTEAHITDAFRDLSRRAGTVAVDNGPHVQAAVGGRRRSRRAVSLFGGPSGRPSSDNRLIPALAFAVLAVVAGFGAWQLLPDDSGSADIATDGSLSDDDTADNTNDSDGAVVTDDGTTDSTDTTDSSGTDAPVVGEAGARYRVDTAKVAADTSDPFLNVRSAPDAGARLLAKLPPTYRGIELTGASGTADDGATWFEVKLIDPVQVNLGEPLHGGQPVGWVNAAFLIPLEDGIAVGTNEVPACAFLPEERGSFGGLTGTGYVYGLESRRLGDDCLRVVVTLGAGSNPFMWEEVPAGTGPAGALPNAFVSSSGGMGVTVELGDTIASAWPSATDTDDDVYIARGADGSVDLVTPLPVSRVGITPLPESGIIVIDMEVVGDAPRTGPFVALTDEPNVSAGTVTVTGLARPFEANLHVSIIDGNGQPVAAVYSGSAHFGTLRSPEYAVQTNDWTDAWGRFAVTATDLQPGSYTMLLDGEGGVENPRFTRVPFTITEGPTSPVGEPDAGEQAVAQALVLFAQGDPLTDVNLADEVVISLGLDHQSTFSRSVLEDRRNWSIDYEPFAARTGPFNLLDLLADGQVEFSTGTIPHCASPPLDWPPEWDALTQINIQPVNATSCIEWYAVSLFRNANGEVEVIVLDLFEP